MAERAIFFNCDQRPILESLIDKINEEDRKVQAGQITAEEALSYIVGAASYRKIESDNRPQSRNSSRGDIPMSTEFDQNQTEYTGTGPIEQQSMLATGFEDRRPSEEELRDELSRRIRTERPQPMPAFEAIPITTANVDTTDLLKKQAQFIATQTWFLEEGRGMETAEYAKAVTQYSRAQSDLIRAQAHVLHALGVI